jgi:hypothetical protein
VAVLVVADRRVACSVVGSSSSLRIFLMFFSFYSIAEVAAVTLEVGRLQAAVAAIFFFFPVQRAQPLFFLLVVLPFSVFFAYSVFSVVVLSGSGVGGGMKVVAVVALFFSLFYFFPLFLPISHKQFPNPFSNYLSISFSLYYSPRTIFLPPFSQISPCIYRKLGERVTIPCPSAGHGDRGMGHLSFLLWWHGHMSMGFLRFVQVGGRERVGKNIQNPSSSLSLCS